MWGHVCIHNHEIDRCQLQIGDNGRPIQAVNSYK